MIAPRIERLVREALALDFEDRDRALFKQRNQTVSVFVRNGTLDSTMCARAIAELFQEDLKIRGALALQVYHRLASAYPEEADSGILDAAKSLLVPMLESERARLEKIMLDQTPFKRGGGTKGPAYSHDLAEALDTTKRKLLLDAEILEAQMSVKKTDGGGATTVNVTGYGNIVQAGLHGSTGAIILDRGSAEALSKALDLVRDGLAGVPDGAGVVKGDVLEMVEEAKQEIAKATPNKSKIATLAKGVAESVRTVAALKPAYESLKGALAYLGISI